MKVSEARLIPAFTSEECSGRGNETASVRIASTRLNWIGHFQASGNGYRRDEICEPSDQD